MPIILNGSAGETFPTWTTAGRPATPNQGQTGYNTTINTLETYDGSAWTPTGANPTITQTIYTSGSGTYTVPTGVKWLRVRMVGGGGGGGGGGNAVNNGTSGGSTTFGSSFLTCTGGGGGVSNGSSSVVSGGTATINAGASGVALSGGTGTPTFQQQAYQIGNTGAASPFGGAGSGCYVSGNTTPAGAANTGSGGGGGGASGGTAAYGGGGGGAGGYIDCIISAPVSSYSYAVGAGGNAGAAGTSGIAAGAGGSGVIIIEEHYNW